MAAAAALLALAFVSPRASPAPARTPALSVVGAEEVVYDWSRSACDDADIPDLPARAFRDFRGRTVLVMSHYVNRLLVGPDLNHLVHRCSVVMASGGSSSPARFAGRQWLASPYTTDGKTVFALVHDEFQGNRHPGRCPSGEYFKCWYNAITLAVSRDGGRSFVDARRPPGHLVASYPYTYRPDAGPAGIFEPSNIVRNPRDGYYYAVARIVGYGNSPRGTCVLRTRTLGDPGSWRAWDGSGFALRFVDPYRTRDERARHVCAPVANAQIGEMTQSLTYNSYLGRFLLVGGSGKFDPSARRDVWGFYFSLSDDLVHWTDRRLIMEVELPWTFRCGDRDPVLYPSLIDPASRSRNFETTGRTAYLYFTRFHYDGCDQGPNRDLVRLPIEISK